MIMRMMRNLEKFYKSSVNFKLSRQIVSIQKANYHLEQDMVDNSKIPISAALAACS